MQDNSSSHFNRVTNLSKRFMQGSTSYMPIPCTSNSQSLPEPVILEINELKTKSSELERKQHFLDCVNYYLIIVCMLIAFTDFWTASSASWTIYCFRLILLRVYSYCYTPVILVRVIRWLYDNKHKGWKEISAEWEEERKIKEQEQQNTNLKYAENKN